MTGRQRYRANALIKKLCANYDDGNCLLLDEGEGCVCVQSISYSLLCRYFRNAVLPAGAEITADGDGVALVPSPIIGSQDYDGYYDRYR